MTTIYLIIGTAWGTCCEGDSTVAAYSTQDDADAECYRLTEQLAKEAADFFAKKKDWLEARMRQKEWPPTTSYPDHPAYCGYSVQAIELKSRL